MINNVDGRAAALLFNCCCFPHHQIICPDVTIVAIATFQSRYRESGVFAMGLCVDILYLSVFGSPLNPVGSGGLWHGNSPWCG